MPHIYSIHIYKTITPVKNILVNTHSKRNISLQQSLGSYVDWGPKRTCLCKWQAGVLPDPFTNHLEPSLNDFFLRFTSLFIYLCVYRPKSEDIQYPGAGVTSGCEPTKVGAGNRTWVLHSCLLSHLSSPVFFFLHTFLEKHIYMFISRTEEMAQLLRTQTALPGDWSFILNTPIRWLTTAFNSSGFHRP